MKYIAILVLMFFGQSLAYGEGLTANQLAAIEQIVGGSNSTVKPPISPDDVQKWVDLGSNIGAGLAASARELGMAASEFSTTTPGKVVVGIIVWKTLGSSIAKILAGLIVIFFGFTYIMYTYIKQASSCEIEYDTSCKNIFGNYPILKKKKESLSSDFLIGMSIFAGVDLLVGMICILNA